jgi:nucleoid-associated protein YgaU
MGLSFNENTGKYASSHSKAYDIDERITEKSLKSINTSPAKFVPSTERKYSNKSVQDKADKEYMDAEVNTLYADCEVVPDESAVKLKIGETVNVSGVGKYLSGEHYVHEISRRISKDDGYTVSMTLIRMGFGDSLKSVAPKNVVDAPVQTQKYVIKRGDTLWEIAEKYYGKGSEYTKIAEANGIKPIDYRRLKIGRELIIP